MVVKDCATKLKLTGKFFSRLVHLTLNYEGNN